MAEDPNSKDKALEALDFIINVLKEHEQNLDKSINELATVTEQIGDTEALNSTVGKVEEKINNLQKEVTNLIGYLSNATKELLSEADSTQLLLDRYSNRRVTGESRGTAHKSDLHTGQARLRAHRDLNGRGHQRRLSADHALCERSGTRPEFLCHPRNVVDRSARRHGEPAAASFHMAQASRCGGQWIAADA